MSEPYGGEGQAVFPDPYAAPGGALGPPPMEARKSTSLKVLGILSIAFGAITILSDFWDLVSALFQKQSLESLKSSPFVVPSAGPGAAGSGGGAPAMPGFTKMTDAMTEFMEAMTRYTAIKAPIMIVMSIALVVIGVGLLKQKAVFRNVAFVWCGAAFVVLVARIASFELWVWPKTQAFMKLFAGEIAATGGGFATIMNAFARLSEYGSVLVLAIYPVVLGSLLMTRGVKSALGLSSSEGGT